MCFLDAFSGCVRCGGDAPALTDHDGNRTMSYRELDGLSNRICRQLMAEGIGKGDSVIIRLPRCSEYIACEIALLKLGATIVPLIPEYPGDRVSYIRQDCGASLVISGDFLEKIKDVPETPPETADCGDDERGMVIYTSGSTGNPKGVVYTRGNLDAQIRRSMAGIADLGPLVFAASATMSFCVTVCEYLRTLAMGGHVHVISDETRSDAEKLSRYYCNNGITTGFIPPRILKQFVCKSETLRRVYTASEKVVNIWSPDFEIINSYGQSETVGAITEFRIDRLYDNTPIGRPVGEVEIVITGEDNQPVPQGTEGQICIIGDLPSEYNNLPDQTEKVFRTLPDGRTYICSGDIGKELPDGNILYLNRNDWMIKIHGQRVEPGEIESVMNRTEGVTGSVVKAFDNPDGTMLLCGFYTEERPVAREDIRKMLEAKLPPYMIPGVLVKMDVFPVNANGKIDRKAIERPDISKRKAAYEPPADQAEEAICLAMQKILQVDRISRNDDFFELGGNSINAVALCAECAVPGIAPQIVIIGKTPAVIAGMIRGKCFVPKPEFAVFREIDAEYPMSMAQKYQYEVCRSLGTTIDVIDMTYYFPLDGDVDSDRLKKAVEDVVNGNPIYRSHIDLERERLLVDRKAFSVREVHLNADAFGPYRAARYTRVRDLKTDPLFECELIRLDDGSAYLFLCLCHLLYDGKSLENLLDSISARYDGRAEETERASIFDLIRYERRLREESALTEMAGKVLRENYEGLQPCHLFDRSKTYATALSAPILEGVRQEEIDAFLKANAVSVLTVMQVATERTISQVWGIDDFCYMNVYDGRMNQMLNRSHGVFARSVFMRSGVNRYASDREYMVAVEEQYQKLVYYDVADTFSVVEKYPAVKSGITLNYRDMLPLSLKLGGKAYRTEFLSEFFAVNKPFTDMDFMINRLPRGMGYLVNFSSARVDEAFARNFVSLFDGNLHRLLEGEEHGIH